MTLVNDPAGGRRELTKTQNRQTILAAARQVFAELGYGAATVRDIIRATPLASGTFYNYFKSKEEVYLALRDEVALAIRPRLKEERARAGTVEEFLFFSFRAFFEFVAQRKAELRPAGGGKSGWRLDTPEVIAGFDELRGDLREAVGRGLFPTVDTDFLVAAFIGVAFEIAGQLLARDGGDPSGAAQFATKLFLGGITALPPAT